MPDHPFGLSENPFTDGHDRRFIYTTPARGEAVALLRKRIADGESFVEITGDSGCGKTSIVTELLEDPSLTAKVAFVAHPSLTPSELLEAVCIEFGAPLPSAPSKPQTLASLEHHLRELKRQGFAAVLVLDEAHGLKTELLEEARLLSNMKAEGRGLVHTILVGLPELERRLGLPELAQLRQRIAGHCRIGPLTEEETGGYLRHRVTAAGGDGRAIFPIEACHEVHNYTNGMPRDINTLAGRALECAAHDAANAVSVEHVRIAAGDARPRGIATAARPPGGAQPFELRRKAIPGRLAPERPRGPEPSHAPERPRGPEPSRAPERPWGPEPSRAPDRPEGREPPTAAPRTEAGRLPSFLRAQQAARAGDRPVGVAAPAAPPTSLDERLPPPEMRPDGLDTRRSDRPRPGGALEQDQKEPEAHVLGSENLQELGASVLLLALLVTVLMVTGRWDPILRPAESQATHPAARSAPVAEPPAPPQLPTTLPAQAAIEPDTPLPRLPDPGPEPLVITPDSDAGGAGRQAYGFEVASSIYPDSAAAVLRRIMRGTKLPVRIVVKSTGDTYRVVIGPFPQRRQAEQAIQELFRAALVERARLVQMPHQEVVPAPEGPAARR